MGDAKPLRNQAYATVQLYTTVSFDTVETLANEFRQDDRRRGLKF